MDVFRLLAGTQPDKKNEDIYDFFHNLCLTSFVWLRLFGTASLFGFVFELSNQAEGSNKIRRIQTFKQGLRPKPSPQGLKSFAFHLPRRIPRRDEAERQDDEGHEEDVRRLYLNGVGGNDILSFGS